MKLDEFSAFLVQRGIVKGGLNSAAKSAAEGIVALAAGSRVSQKNIDDAVALAKGAGVAETGLMAINRVGTLLLEFEAYTGAPVATRRKTGLSVVLGGRVASRIGPARAKSEPSSVTVPPAAHAPPPEEDPVAAAVAAPLPAQVMGPVTWVDPSRAQLNDVPAKGDVAVEPPSELAPAPAPELDSEYDLPRLRRRKRWIAAGGVAVAGLAAAFVLARVLRAPEQAGGPSPLVRLEAIDLNAAFPAGWQLKSTQARAQPVAGGAARMQVVYRGGTVAAPEHGAFMAVLPIGGELSAGAAISDQALLRATAYGVRGVAGLVMTDEARYRSQGCAVKRISSRRMGVCQGQITRQGENLSLRTYLQVGQSRAVLSLFAARPSAIDAKAEADAIAASVVL